ncbi:Ldh family oxidoreductase [Pikeienuella sp. HZG-20]|uniref:Ldh family oxidoreductase n=1 Tax=Paludibacillus litoralis TaxID=3133267 RepID=UPI0030EF726E
MTDAWQLNSLDNVATLATAGAAGEVLRLRGAGEGRSVVLAEAVDAGHKCALTTIAAEADVVKYGAAIGRARKAIGKGERVHSHNLVSRYDPTPKVKAGPAAHIAPDILRMLVQAALEHAGAAPEAAADFAAHCVDAELSGVSTHGLRRLPGYLARLRAGGVDGCATPVIEGDGAVLQVDGQNGIGHHVARLASDAAVARARELGAAVALVRGSNHFGYAGWYAARIAAHGMVGMAVSNGQVLVGPPGAKAPIFSNDPVALAAPGGFEFDMATSITSRANIAASAELGEIIAEGLALDSQGRPTTNAAAALEGILLPLGGAKGFGLIAALEVLAGLLPGGAYADLVASKEADPAQGEGTSHFLMAIDLAACCGASAFEARMRDLAGRLAGLEMAEGQPAARLPGVRRAASRARGLVEGIALDALRLAELQQIASDIGGSLELKEPSA